MRKLIVYFHGYGGSPSSGKVDKLEQAGYEVYAWKIDVDPSVSMPRLDEKIMNMLTSYIHDDIELVFIGTSLGGWYAAKLAETYDCKSILINPSPDPSASLSKYDISKEVLARYTPLNFNRNQTVFIGTEDEVIDFTGVNFKDAKVIYVGGGDHRFDDHFNHVIDYLNIS
jgi:predicted esterase YcpF (UPF0227 family)